MALSPLHGAARLAGLRGRVLLHSARDDDGLGRWSFAAAEPRATLIGRGRSLVELDASGRPARRFTADPFEAAEAFLEDVLQRHRAHLPRFWADDESSPAYLPTAGLGARSA